MGEQGRGHEADGEQEQGRLQFRNSGLITVASENRPRLVYEPVCEKQYGLNGDDKSDDSPYAGCRTRLNWLYRRRSRERSRAIYCGSHWFEEASICWMQPRSVLRQTPVRRLLLLPTAAQRLVELHQSNEFVRLGLRQSQRGGEGICFIGQHFQVVGGPGLEAHLRQPRRILS